jgi:hypothetical protein
MYPADFTGLVAIFHCLIHLARGDLNEPIFDQLGDTTDAFHLLHHLDFIQGFFISPNGPVVLDYKLLIVLPHMIANSTAAHKTLPRKNNIQNVIKMVVDQYLPDWLWQRFEKRILRDLLGVPLGSYRHLHRRYPR